jgi:hypothetical protein
VSCRRSITRTANARSAAGSGSARPVTTIAAGGWLGGKAWTTGIRKKLLLLEPAWSANFVPVEVVPDAERSLLSNAEIPCGES